MAILTSKGVKASHQLRGVRKVRISRDRRGSGDVSSIENRIDTLEDDVDTLEDDVGDLKTTATQAQTTATQAQTTATQAQTTATQASENATQASQTATQAQTTATQASQTATQADEKIGDLADLETTAKNNLVSAINEVNGTLEETTLTFEGGETVLKRKGDLLFIESRIDTEIEPTFPATVGENIPERFRPTQDLRLPVHNNTTDQPIGQLVYDKNTNKFRMFVTPSLVPQNGEVVVATGITPLW